MPCSLSSGTTTELSTPPETSAAMFMVAKVRFFPKEDHFEVFKNKYSSLVEQYNFFPNFAAALGESNGFI